jgi:hypothetical protein
MKNFISRSMLGQIEESVVMAKSAAFLNEAVAAASSRGPRSTECTVFLSHKHSDRELVRKAIALFQSLGVAVYVDWLDSSMTTATSGQTAAKLKKKIKDCRKFVLLATDDAVASKWCNWELGLGDAAKYFQHIAILPIADPGKTWSGSEYLQIYPVVTSEYQTLPQGPCYVEFGNETVPLVDWLRR